jgi:hypothetical protein
MSPVEYDENDPEVIQAKAEAERVKMEARAKLHPAAQVALSIMDSVSDTIMGIGCLVVIVIALLILTGNFSRLLGQ